MTIHFYLDRNKKLKSKERAIYCYIRAIEKGKTIILNTKQRIDPSYWDKKKERAIVRGNGKYDASKELNEFLDSFSVELKRTYRKFLANNPTATYEDIEQTILQKFGKGKKAALSFFEALELFIDTREKDLSPETIKKYRTIKKHLIEYETTENTKLSFSRIDLLFYDRFLLFLLNERKMVNNSAYKVIGLLKIFLNWTFDRGINANQAYKKFKVKEEKVDIITLSQEEINKLFELDLYANEKLSKARDLFLFGVFTGGRFTDLTKIENADIRNGTWYLRVNKTRDILEIPLNDRALAILAKYKENATPLPRLSNQKLNAYIKEICQLAKINESIRITRFSGSTQIDIEEPKYKLITVHTARRTFITQSLLRGMKAEIVMSISGHKNFKTFKKYLDITRRDKEIELKNAWN